MSAGFLTVKLLFIPHSILSSLKGHYAQPTLAEQGILLYLFVWEYLHKLFGILLYWSFISSPCLFIQPFIHIKMNSLIFFILWVIIQYFVFQIVPSLANEVHSVGSCISLSWLWAYLGTFLLSDTTKCSRLTLCISCPGHPSPRISHFSQKPWPFYWRMVLEATFWS